MAITYHSGRRLQALSTDLASTTVTTTQLVWDTTQLTGYTASNSDRTVTKTASSAWNNSSAIATASFTVGNKFSIEFERDSLVSTSTMLGLSTSSSPTAGTGIAFSVYMAGDSFEIYENGSFTLRSGGTPSASDRYKIEVSTNGDVNYYLDAGGTGTWVWKQKSANTASGTYYVNSSSYSQNSTGVLGNSIVTTENDLKPTNVQAGSRIEETDTRKMYHYNDSYTLHKFTNSASTENFVVTGSGDVDVLVVAGGGGGGGTSTNWAGAGGGGAGGYIKQTNVAVTAQTYTITIGAGGSGGAGGGHNSGSTGGDTTFATELTAKGGGGGGSNSVGIAGGSGGGGSYNGNTGGAETQTGQSGYSGTFGFGGNGGTRDSVYNGGGGGGASANASGKTGSNGKADSITGSSVTRAGGGGGGEWNINVGGAGGTGGGGTGGISTSNTVPTAGVVNTGSGGGGGYSDTSKNSIGAGGGSGIVIIRYKIGSGITATGGAKTTITSTAYWKEEGT